MNISRDLAMNFIYVMADFDFHLICNFFSLVYAYREAKKDPTGLQAYRLLVSIHKGFEQISEKILATDRIRREVAEYEMKLAATASTSLDVSKLQADLDVIIRENEYPG